MQRLSFTAGGQTFAVTISQGLTSLGADDSLEALYVRADEAMYQAKHSGKNCIVLG